MILKINMPVWTYLMKLLLCLYRSSLPNKNRHPKGHQTLVQCLNVSKSILTYTDHLYHHGQDHEIHLRYHQKLHEPKWPKKKRNLSLINLIISHWKFLVYPSSPIPPRIQSQHVKVYTYDSLMYWCHSWQLYS